MHGETRQRESIQKLVGQMLSEARRCLLEGRVEAAMALVQRAEEWLAIPLSSEDSGERPVVRRGKS
jgi:hypothetical protein